MHSSAKHEGPFGVSPPLALAVGLGVLLVVRLVALAWNATDLFFDEAQYWSWSREPSFGYYSKPPLIAWIIAVATSVCGDGEACIRLPAPLIHTATAVIVYLIGARLHGRAVGAWAGLGFATLPGISLSAGIISTDVPLLFCWALALWALIAMRHGDGWYPPVVLGIALGLGLNAKYAMAFFVGCLAVYLVVTPEARRLLMDIRLWVALAVGGLAIAPNLAWNYAHSFATFAHTADNANWGGRLVNVGKGFEFVAAQAIVFGPILLAALAATVHRAWRDGLPEGDRLLLAFTLPVLAVITAQAFVSRAHANWAAVSYVAGVVLVTSTLLRLDAARWLRASLALHVAIMALLVAGTTFAGRFTVPLAGDPFQRTLGWRGLADVAAVALKKARDEGRPFRAIMADDRSITASLLYYLRRDPTPVVAWRDAGRPKDHYELTRPLRDPAQAPVLLISIRRDASAITGRFTTVEKLDESAIAAGLGEARRVRFYALSGLQ